MINVDPAGHIWRKAGRCAGDNSCVEVAVLPAGVGIRDSENPSRPVIAVSAGVFAEFVGRVKEDGVW
jgi:hypothetical protein